ncbi:MAG: hypothetical protein ACRCU0_05295 [Candidatus Rhabdochlamydia sp.]
MSISPVKSPLPGPSSANFSFFPDAVEPLEASSSQERPLKDRIKSIIDRMGYETYSIFNPPEIMPEEVAEAQYKVDKKKFFADKPKPFEEIQQRVLDYPADLCEWSWGHRIERANIELYSNPEFRKNKVQEYANHLYEGRYSTVTNEEEWLVLSLCKQELHDLYRKEPKYLRSSVPTRLWIIRGHNKPVLARHKAEWDALSASEKTEKIFGKPKKYEIAAGIITASSCFFLCHTIYRQLSPRE